MKQSVRAGPGASEAQSSWAVMVITAWSAARGGAHIATPARTTRRARQFIEIDLSRALYHVLSAGISLPRLGFGEPAVPLPVTRYSLSASRLAPPAQTP